MDAGLRSNALPFPIRRSLVLSQILRRAALAALGALIVGAPAAEAARGPAWRVTDVRTAHERSRVAATGADVVQADHGSVLVDATRRERSALRRAGFRVDRRPVQARAAAFPAADSAFHDFPELTTALQEAAARHPDLVQLTSIGRSYQGRELWAIKVSDQVATDEAEPEVLFTAGQHAREHLTVEMALYVLDELTSTYGTDERVRRLVDTRELWIVPNVNPDGSEHDVETGTYRGWRKNRQPTAGTTQVGTDLNRNWAFRWGCCGGASGDPASATFRGPSAFSAPESDAVRRFVDSRVIGGVQQIRAAIDWHAYSELVLWPPGYTTNDTAPELTADDAAALAQLGRNMAATNGYTPEQSSDLYVVDGGILDWLWAHHRIFAYTFELFPKTSTPGFYPADEVIPAETARNREAVLQLLEAADCPYRVIGKEATHCAGERTPVPPPPAPRLVFGDDFEADRGWRVNAAGTDTATAGRFERGDPAATSVNGAKQLGTTVSGVNDLVTGRLAGSNADANDVDGGRTTMTSPAIALTGTGSFRLELSAYLAHASSSSADDGLRVRVVGPTTSATLVDLRGAAANRNGAWASGGFALDAFAGQTVRIVVEATDAAGASLVEAGVDDVRVVAY